MSSSSVKSIAFEDARPVGQATGETPYLAFMSIGLLALMLITFFAWASMSELEEVTRGQGRIIPSSREQVIQSLDPGILTEMLVREGDTVEKGQLLLRIDDTRASALYRELQAKTVSLAASAARLRAEAYGGEPDFADEVRASPDVLNREMQAFKTRTQALETSLSGLKRGVQLLDREIRITEPMVRRGLVSEVELLRLRRQRNDTALQISDRRDKFRADAAADLIKFESELAQARESLTARADTFKRTEIHSPDAGHRQVHPSQHDRRRRGRRTGNHDHRTNRRHTGCRSICSSGRRRIPASGAKCGRQNQRIRLRDIRWAGWQGREHQSGLPCATKEAAIRRLPMSPTKPTRTIESRCVPKTLS